MTRKILYIVLGVSLILLISSFKSKKMNPKNKTILFIGDSHTAGFGWGWQSYLSKLYGFKEINLSKGGVQTSYMVKVLTNYLSDSKNVKPDICFIYGGANDAYSPQTNKTALSNIQKMVDLCNKNNITPIVVVGYNSKKVIYGNPAVKPFGTNTQQSLWNFALKRYDMQKNIPNVIKNAIIVPMWENVNHDTAKMDGYHLSSAYQREFGNFVAQQIFD